MKMRLHFYWDMYLILNFLMNLFLLNMTALYRRKRLLKFRVILASFTGSSLMTGLTVLWLRYAITGGRRWDGRAAAGFWGAASLFIAWGMLAVVFPERNRRERLRNLGAFLVLSLLTGGAVLLCLEWTGSLEVPGLWLVVLGGLGVTIILFFVQRLTRNAEGQKHVMDAILYTESGEQYTLRVLLDTGNQLVSPYTGEKVMILSQKLADQMQLKQTGMPLQIPYHSIGGDGLMPAYRLYKLKLQDGMVLQDFLAAVSPRLTKDSEIQMIVPKL